MKLDATSILLGIGAGAILLKVAQSGRAANPGPDGVYEGVIEEPGSLQLGSYTIPAPIAAQLRKLAEAGTRICYDTLKDRVQGFIEEGTQRIPIFSATRKATIVNRKAIESRLAQVDQTLQDIRQRMPAEETYDMGLDGMEGWE